MNKFSVVEFIKDNTIEVVPTTWIEDDLSHCYYKLGPSVARLRKDPNSKPVTTKWPRYKINLRCQHENFNEAAKACDRLQFTSNLDSNDSSGSEIDLSRRSRKRTQRKPYSPPNHIKSKQGNTVVPKTYKSKAKKSLFSSKTTSTATSGELAALPHLFSTPDGNDGNDEVNAGPSDISDCTAENIGLDSAQNLEQLQENLTERTDREQLQTVILGQILPPEQPYFELENSNSISVAGSFSSGSNTSNYGGQSLLLTPSTGSLFSPSPSIASETLSEIRRFQEVVLRELGSIKEEVQIIKTWVKRGEGAWSSPIQVPFSSEVELNSAEAQLSSEATRSAFQSWCELIGGSDYKHHVRRALGRLFAHEFSLMVNMSGVSSKGKKIAFASTCVCKILLNAVSKSNNVKEDLVEKAVGKWFRGGSDRNGGRSERKH